MINSSPVELDILSFLFPKPIDNWKHGVLSITRETRKFELNSAAV